MIFKAIDRIEGMIFWLHEKLRWPSLFVGQALVVYTIAHTHDNPHGWQWAPGLIGMALLGQAFIP